MVSNEAQQFGLALRSIKPSIRAPAGHPVAEIPEKASSVQPYKARHGGIQLPSGLGASFAFSVRAPPLCSASCLLTKITQASTQIYPFPSAHAM